MRAVLSLLLLAAAPLVAAAQTAGGAPPAPAGLSLEKPEWEVIPAYFFGTGGDGGPSGPAVHPNPRPGNQLSYSRGHSSRGGGVFGPSTGEDLWRRATVRMTNVGTRSVKLVRMDFVFQDKMTGEELLRIRHASKKRLRPGKTFLHQKTVRRSPLTRRGDGARMRVELAEVVYADGTVWRR